MNRINKKKIVLFICSFLGCLFLMIFVSKVAGFKDKELGAFRWEDVIRYLPVDILCSLGFAGWVIWGGLGDELIETFSDGFFRKRKNEKNEK